VISEWITRAVVRGGWRHETHHNCDNRYQYRDMHIQLAFGSTTQPAPTSWQVVQRATILRGELATRSYLPPTSEQIPKARPGPAETRGGSESHEERPDCTAHNGTQEVRAALRCARWRGQTPWVVGTEDTVELELGSRHALSVDRGAVRYFDVD